MSNDVVSYAEIEDGIYREMARRIITLRRLAGMSASALAKAAGIKRETLSKIENVRNKPGMDILVRITVVLDVPLYILFAPMAQWKEFIGKDL